MGQVQIKSMSESRQLVINLIASIVATVVNYGISLLFTPYLVRTAGGEAYGFVSLANNMVNYASIVTIALSSVAGRFIAIEVHKGNQEKANIYFNSVFWANMVLAAAFMGASLLVVPNLHKIIKIPQALVSDVKLLFLFIFINFIITVVSNVFNVATFITNKLYLTSLGNCISSLIRVGLLAFFYGVFPARVMYIGVAACVCTIFLAVYNLILTSKLTKELFIDIQKFSFSYVKELLSAGIWSSVTRLSQILSDGLDLLISNIWIGSYEMGQLSISYTIPTLLGVVISTIVSLFSPQQTFYYAKGEIVHVVEEIKQNMKLTGFFISIILCGFAVYGYEFFCLWVPQENIKLIYQLALISVLSVFVSGVTSSLSNVFLLTNHLKVNSIVWLMVSMIDAVVVLVLVNSTRLGIYAVAGVSKIVGLVVNVTYLPLYASRCLRVSGKTFYPIIIRYMCNTVLILAVFVVMKQILPAVSGWTGLMINCLLMGAAGGIINFFAFLNHRERKFLLSLAGKKINH